jgi:hypothetical protein
MSWVQFHFSGILDTTTKNWRAQSQVDIFSHVLPPRAPIRLIELTDETPSPIQEYQLLKRQIINPCISRHATLVVELLLPTTTPVPQSQQGINTHL